MVGGQVIDLQHENQRAPIEVLLEMDRKRNRRVNSGGGADGMRRGRGGSKSKERRR